jgi:thiamine biosynthesis lipoprotein ApbE
LDVIYLKQNALSGSGVKKGQHIIDPRIAKPVIGKSGTWAVAPDGATSDGLSTAFMVMQENEIRDFCTRYPSVRALVVYNREQEPVIRIGEW